MSGLNCLNLLSYIGINSQLQVMKRLMFLVLGLSLFTSVAYLYTNRSVFFDLGKGKSSIFSARRNDLEADYGENALVVERGGDTIYEGNKLPSDARLEEIIPIMPPSSVLQSVKDTQTSKFRNLLINYQITKDLNSARQLVIEGLAKKEWNSISEGTNGLVYAEKDKIKIKVGFSEIGRVSTMATFSIVYYK